MMRRHLAVCLALAACALMAAGCAGTKPRSRYVEARDGLYVPLPVVPAEVDSLMVAAGWPAGRFALELRKEIRYQFGRKGVSAGRDSSGANARLEVTLDRYDEEEYAVRGSLTTPSGSRAFRFIERKRAAPVSEDAPIYDIRTMADRVVEEARADPARKRAKKEEYPVNLMQPLL